MSPRDELIRAHSLDFQGEKDRIYDLYHAETFKNLMLQ